MKRAIRRFPSTVGQPETNRRYYAKSKTLIVNKSTVITEQGFGGWQARVSFSNPIQSGSAGSSSEGGTNPHQVGLGANSVRINGVPMLASDMVDYTCLAPSVLWDEPIVIEITGTAQVALTLLYYKE